ncbi:hypothetical protein POJ06DRAFT_284686 [Lipomyces tetrasporus]|uniref:Uncharacterized protein n=1 Tax=Lipomyces tetrasporus TaxID=54092 RepID=A0AAD7QYB3_9ASCO|nr:uncharacterized protein POJ06DRAFT_284686 [Lipomyces tetrasporus]KAJ8103694.1 hypothetical protein POJ06DRAFT_284686 [Lipomyces tetrasporus]
MRTRDLTAIDEFEFTRDYIIRAAFVFEGQLDQGRLRQSLTTFITRHAPAFGSRVRKKADGNLEFYTPNAFDDTTLPFFWHSTDNLSRPLAADMKLATTDTASVDVQDIQDFSRVFIPTTERNSKDFIGNDRPMLSIYISLYKDYTAMLFAASHMLCDGSGLKLLFDGWQQMLNGDPVTPVTDEFVLPNIIEKGSTLLPVVSLGISKKLAILSNLLWSGIKYGKPTQRRIVISQDLLEKLRAKVQSVAEFYISRYDVVLAISARLCAIGRGSRSCDILVGSAADMRRRLGNNDNYIHNFFLTLSERMSTHQILKMSFVELVLHLKSFLRQFSEHPNELAKIFNLLESVKPSPGWLFPFDINMVVTHWGSFKFTQVNFNAAAYGGDKNPKLGKVVTFEPLMEWTTVTDAGVVTYDDGPNGHGGIILNHIMQKRNWDRVEAALSGLEMYIESLVDE